ncbi:MAG TPA: hypothetical protein VGK23_09790 [Methanomassiliicoccales archaeon]|jgi:hypothetical protein
MVKIGLRSLVVCAGVALLLLSILSDLSPERVDLFKDVKVGNEGTVECVVVQCNHSKTGLIITAMDKDGAGASIFLPPSVLAAPVPPGSVIKVVLTPSEDDPTFMFASSFELIS